MTFVPTLARLVQIRCNFVPQNVDKTPVQEENEAIKKIRDTLRPKPLSIKTKIVQSKSLADDAKTSNF